jgi:hypothetical protein
LIALIIDAHRSAAVRHTNLTKLRNNVTNFRKMAVMGSNHIKTSFASNTPEDVAVMLRPLTEALAVQAKPARQSDVFPLYDVR